MKKATDLFDEIIRCLITFQHVEHYLKMVLFRIEIITQERLKGILPYKIKSKIQPLETLPLGRLIDRYKIYCDDPELIKELRELQRRRDHVAHQSLIQNPQEMADEDNVNQMVIELEQWNKEALETLTKFNPSWDELDSKLKELKSNKTVR